MYAHAYATLHIHTHVCGPVRAHTYVYVGGYIRACIHVYAADCLRDGIHIAHMYEWGDSHPVNIHLFCSWAHTCRIHKYAGAYIVVVVSHRRWDNVWVFMMVAGFMTSTITSA